MKAVILAAGQGVRMRPLTYEVPKPMLEVHGKPLVAYTVAMLPAEIDEVVFVVGYLGEQIKKYFGDSYLGKKISYVQQDELNGTGGALWLCRPQLTKRFVVLMGDDMYCAHDMIRCLEHEQSMLVKEVTVEERRGYGAMTMDAHGNLTAIEEKELSPGDHCLVNTGLYVLTPQIFHYDLVPIKDGKEFGLPQTVVTMTNNSHPVRLITTDYWLPVGYPDDLKRAEIHLRKHGMITD